MIFYIYNISTTTSNNLSLPPGRPYSMIFMLISFLLIFYFMILYPQQKSAKEHKKLIESIGKGNEILTAGGLVGRVIKIKDNYIIITLNDHTTELMIKRDYIISILPKGTMKYL